MINRHWRRSVIKTLLSLMLLVLAGPLHAQQGSVTPTSTLAQPVSPAAGLTQSDATSQQSLPTSPATVNAARPLPQSARVERDMSPWTMFMSADILVKLVMISLIFASFVTWTIFIAKTVQLALARKRLNAALVLIADARTLAQAQLALGQDRSIVSVFLATAIRECKLSAGSLAENGIKDRVASNLIEMTRAEARSVRLGMAVLATIGSTSPFVGLFGTVWGIMNSFIGISKSQTTNLAVVAPGIAEALLATATGLVAAIPAVIIYNHFSRTTKGYVDLISRGAGAVNRLLSRDVDLNQGCLVSRAAE